jgi:asparagine synthase (glutamine-hydrolysing)
LSIVAQFRVFEEARRQGLTVMLDGQGADELFGGYPSFVCDRFVEHLRRGRLASAWRLTPAISRTSGPAAVGRCLARALPRQAAVAVWRQWLDRQPVDWFDRDWFRERGVETRSDPRSLTRGLDEALAYSVSSSSLPALLRYEDRNSMAHSVESRVPYLTTEIAALAASFPRDHLITPAGTTKAVLREALRGLVVDEILDRRDKVAFRVPNDRWTAQLHGGTRPDSAKRWRAGQVLRHFPELSEHGGPLQSV